MIKVIAGVFLILHALVHLLYFGQSARLFELKPGMQWPDGAWIFSKLLGDHTTRTLAIAFCILAAAGFILGAAGIFFSQPWWRTITIASGVFSIVLYILFWNGRLQQLDSQGGVGILIDAVILAAIIVFRWPKFSF
jgi:hypothetical protein